MSGDEGTMDGGTRAWGILLMVAGACLGVVGADLSEPALRPQAPAPLAVEHAPVLSPAESLATVHLVDGFVIELVAAEPMIEDPVAMTFDEDGRLWVVEMRSYMPDMQGNQEQVPTSRVVVLEDTDADGRMDSATTFADGLVLPRAIAPCHGGALLIEPPNLVFLKDTNADGRADERQVLLDGFGGLENPEHAANGLMYGLDNWWELSQHPLRIRFDGRAVHTEPAPGHGQWGITKDDAGLVYYVPNSDSLRGDVVSKRYAVRNPNQNAFSGINERVGRDVDIWPAHVTGINRGYQEHMRREDGTVTVLTAACGPSIYRSAVFGADFRGDAFICEPSCNLIKRLTLTRESGIPVAHNAYVGSEFLTATDERFRPVNSCVGPDGALYIADMYRGLIQHRIYLTDYLADYIRAHGLDAPIGYGRIYRIRPVSWQPTPAPRLSQATDARLVALLAHPDGWWRDTAQRLLVERRSVGMEDELRSMTEQSDDPLARLHALWTLDGLGLAEVEDVLAAGADDDEAVRVAALRLAERWPDNPSVLAMIASLASDDARLVRAQAALALGAAAPANVIDTLEAMSIAYGNDRVVRSAIVSSVGGGEVALLGRLARAERDVPQQMLDELADCAIRSADIEERAELCELIASLAPDHPAMASGLLARVEEAQRIHDDEPHVLVVAREPWRELRPVEAFNLTDRATMVHHYLDWPGRPDAPRPRRVRPLTGEEMARFDRGRQLFTLCAPCHGHDGEGTMAQVPSLAASERVAGNASPLAAILLHGLQGPIESGGQAYDGSMPPALLQSDEQIASVLTFIRRAWDNQADPVSAEMVAEVRTRTSNRTGPWTNEELSEVTW